MAKKKSKQKSAAANRATANQENWRAQKDDAGAEFRRHAEQRQPSIVEELLYMLRTNKMWWLTPILVVLLILGAIIVLGGTAAAPFIYTLF